VQCGADTQGGRARGGGEACVAVVYSQAEGGRQAYVMATSGIVRNHPLYLPPLGEIPVSCGLVDGRWGVVGNRGRLQ